MSEKFDKYYMSNGFNPELFEWVTYFDSSLPNIVIEYDYVVGHDGQLHQTNPRIVKDENGNAVLSHTGESLQMLERDGFTPFEQKCQHCGQWIKYICVYRHIENGELLAVGETCAENRLSLTVDQFDKKREKMRKKMIDSRHKHAETKARWFAEDESRHELIAFLERDDIYPNAFFASLHGYFKSNGCLSEGQEEALRKSIARQIKWERERDAENANATDCPTGNGIEMIGTVASIKCHETQWGYSYKMLVKVDKGFKVFGSIPSAIDEVEKGDKVSFIANVKQSRDDTTFGYFKRPRKATILRE